MRIDFLGIEAFLSVAERGSFHGAAERLNLSQAALSHRMKRLEDDLGVKLFTRTTRQVALTPAGLELLPKVRSIMEALSGSYESLRRQGREKRTTLTIGCLPTIATYYLPPILKRFSRDFPDLSVHVRDTSASQIADMVQKGEAEFGITIVSAHRWDLDSKPLLREPYVLLCPRSHPLAVRPQVGWADFEGVPLIRISAQAANRMIIDDALGSRREFMAWRYEVQHVATAASMVIAGVALTVVPRLAIDVAGSPGLVAVPIINPSVARTVGVVTKRGIPLSEPGELLLKLVAKSLKAEGKKAEA
ncbi:MAG: LysR substrate-binding domain-containing protein [Beijerinckiaceae bacterium]|nr:LysR substrate-binding domain-containing protein [Beijerinckiaceae bacterium]